MRYHELIEGLIKTSRADFQTDLTSHSTILSNPAFVRWFGKSKVVDPKGLPLVCYHGTFQEFSEFKHRAEHVKSHGFDNLGFWFDVHAETASYFAGHDGVSQKTGSVIPVFLRITNPYSLNGDFLFDWDRDDFLAAAAEWKTVSAQYRSVRGDRLPDGSYFDHDRYTRAKKAFDAANTAVHQTRQDSFTRMMKLLPNGPKSTEAEVIAFKKELIANGYDGIHLEATTADWGSRGHQATDWYIAFSSDQIKSIWGNDFTSSPNIHEGL